ncbi:MULTISPECIES: DUF3662 domain-containing protein [unclassified Streptomyces]|uniref:DUF3662 domain-containing protein n=1 Tax=unclassified Streptomyces TaxID=2593676 RepID=UPI0004C716A3|nr:MULTISPECIES: DUF3662 domain-containing protein [unclassified Streptomyces]
MGLLKQMEQVVEECESALIAKIAGNDPVELCDDLRRECDDHAVVCSQHRVLVPNEYTVELAPEVHDELAAQGGQIGQRLTDVLAHHAAKRDYEWAGPLTVHVTAAPVPNGRYRITSSARTHIPAGAPAPRTG